jgi:hypothetical protein
MMLNLDYLRWKSKVRDFSQEENARFSRRQFIQSAAAASFVAGAPRSWLEGRISFHHQGGRAAFRVADRECWTFTQDSLAGSVRLTVLSHKLNEVRLSIIGGHYAGVAIPFDLEVEARQEMLGWSYVFRLPRQGLIAKGDLRDWLSGGPAVWRDAPGISFLDPRSPFQVRSQARSMLTFDRSWNLCCQGHAQITGPGFPGSIAADKVQLSPSAALAEVEPLGVYPDGFSRLTVVRGRNHWGTAFVSPLSAPVVRIDPRVEIFDQLHLDAWESEPTHARVAASFSRSVDEVFPGTLYGDSVAWEGGPVVLPLVRPTYSLATEGSRTEAAFFAAIDRPIAACTADQVTVVDGQIEIIRSIADNGGLSAYLGARQIAINHFEQPDGTQFDFLLPKGYRLPAVHLDHHVIWVERGFDAIEQGLVSLFAAGHFECSLDGVVVRMLRPADMLYLHFSFSGVKLKMHAGKPYIEQAKIGKNKVAKSTMTVHFPPQNLQEESFYEDASGNVPSQLGYATPSPKVKTSSSRPSRLKFILPPSVFKEKLPFSVETLLRWERFEFQPGKNDGDKDGTRIEVPYRLFQTPGSKATFLHDITPRSIANAIPEISAERIEAPALWGTLVQDGNRRARQGYDATPVKTIAFGAADVAEIVQLQVMGGNTVRAYYAEPLKLTAGAAYIYPAGVSCAKYSNALSHEIKITKVLDPDDRFPSLQGIEYTFTGGSLSAGTPLKPEYPLWLVQAPSDSQIGGVKLPPMCASERAQILVLTGGQQAEPITVNRLVLTSLGAYFDADTKWDTTRYPQLAVDLGAWRHITVMGRDEYVQLEHEGYLWPFGHKAALIKRTQRVFYSVKPVDTCGDDKIFCYLRRQEFIHVKEPLKRYPDKRQPNLGRDLPFTSVEITTDTTPPLDPPPASGYFFPQVTLDPAKPHSKFKFDLIGYDWAVPATPIPFKAALVYVPDTPDNRAMAAELGNIESMYQKDGDHVIDFGGQHIHFAASNKAGDTDLKTQTIKFCGQLKSSLCTTNCVDVNFYPAIISAAVDIPAVQALGGTHDSYSDVEFHSKFVSNGYGTQQSNPTEIFLKVLPNPDLTQRTLSFPGQHGGGIAVPTMPINNVSRKRGATSIDIDAKTNLSSFFGTILRGDFPKLFGVIPIYDIVQLEADLNLDQLPAVIPNLVNGAVLAYQRLNNVAEQAKTVVSTTQTLLKSIREDAANQCISLLLDPSVQQQLAKIAPDSLRQSVLDVQRVAVGARKELDKKALALGSELTKLDQLATSAEASLLNLATTLIAQLASAIVQAIRGLILDLFQLEELLDELNSIVQNLRNAEADALTQLKAIQTALQAFSRKQFVDCLVTANCNDLQNQVRSLVAAILKAEMELLVGRVSTAIVQQVAAPVLALQVQVENALDQYSSAQQVAFSSAVEATAGLSANVIQTLNDAEEMYTVALQDAQGKLNDTVATVENTIAEQIAAVINDGAVNSIVAVVMNNVAQLITPEAAANVQKAVAFIEQVLQLVDALEILLGAPIQYGVEYKLPPVALKDAGIFLAGPKANLQIEAKINVTNPSPSQLKFDPTLDYEVDASINDFGIDLLQRSGEANFLTIYFDSVTFSTRTHEHPKVDCKVQTVRFGAALQFVQGLIDAFNPMKTGGSGPLITLTGDGVAIGYGFSFPDMEGGGFQITGLFLGVQVTLSFNGEPMRMKFYFARPEKHFLMSAGIYGGGGYLILEGGPKVGVKPQGLQNAPGGIDAFQMCMEFGATVSLNLGVASGEAHLLGGIYIALNNGQCALTGFIRAGGSMNILGIVTMSIEWYIGLNYSSSSVRGRASVTVSISIGFFSVSATLSMEWTWAGSPARNEALLEGRPGNLQKKPARLGTITPVSWRNPELSASRLAADYDLDDTADPSTQPCAATTNRMQFINEGIWDQYASAFARVPLT